MSGIDAFLQEIDGAWQEAGDRVPLRIIGSTSLMLQTSYYRGTKDSDVLETDEVTGAIAARLREIAGPGTEIHRRRGMYIDIVQRGILSRRQSPTFRGLEQLNAKLRCFDVSAMSVVDVVVGKLGRFNANDRDDIDAMIQRQLVAHDEVVSCFRDAIDFNFGLDAAAFERCVKHLHTIERDMFDVAETEVEEPSGLS